MNYVNSHFHFPSFLGISGIRQYQSTKWSEEFITRPASRPRTAETATTETAGKILYLISRVGMFCQRFLIY
jgi:hypothetical protein